MRISLTPIFWDKPEGRNLKSLKIIMSTIDEMGVFDRETVISNLVREFKITINSSQALLSILGALGIELNNLNEIRILKKLIELDNQENYQIEIISRFQENLLGFKELIMIFTEIEKGEEIEFQHLLQKWISSYRKFSL